MVMKHNKRAKNHGTVFYIMAGVLLTVSIFILLNSATNLGATEASKPSVDIVGCVSNNGEIFIVYSDGTASKVTDIHR